VAPRIAMDRACSRRLGLRHTLCHQPWTRQPGTSHHAVSDPNGMSNIPRGLLSFDQGKGLGPGFLQRGGGPVVFMTPLDPLWGSAQAVALRQENNEAAAPGSATSGRPSKISRERRA
jgi:hypothetical protein